MKFSNTLYIDHIIDDLSDGEFSKKLNKTIYKTIKSYYKDKGHKLLSKKILQFRSIYKLDNSPYIEIFIVVKYDEGENSMVKSFPITNYVESEIEKEITYYIINMTTVFILQYIYKIHNYTFAPYKEFKSKHDDGLISLME